MSPKATPDYPGILAKAQSIARQTDGRFEDLVEDWREDREGKE